jgi:hypothetical protein
MEKKKTEEKYTDLMVKRVDDLQKSGDIPELYSYEFNKKQWVLTLPHSVMEQKRILYARNDYAQKNDFESEKKLLDLIAMNSKVDGRQVVLDQLEIGEIEVLKLSYIDGLILPLFLGGDKAVLKYMEDVVEHAGK